MLEAPDESEVCVGDVQRRYPALPQFRQSLAAEPETHHGGEQRLAFRVPDRLVVVAECLEPARD